MNKNNIFFFYKYVYELFIILFISLLCTYNKFYLAIIILFIISLLFFFRNNLDIKLKPNNFLSPSSSKITKIEKKNNINVVSSYLSPLDKHFMVAPCDCEVINKIYKPQRKTDAECMRHIMKDKYNNTFYMDQIVSKPLNWGWMPSLLYDRCVSFVKIGQKLQQGERYGLIRFGSNMEYGLPLQYKINNNEIINKHHKIGDTIAKIIY